MINPSQMKIMRARRIARRRGERTGGIVLDSGSMFPCGLGLEAVLLFPDLFIVFSLHKLVR
jgi:hypothetical protein